MVEFLDLFCAIIKQLVVSKTGILVKLKMFSSPKEPTIILANYIHYDGIGDFYHLLGFLKALHPYAEQLKIKMIPFIICEEKRKNEVIHQINELSLNLQPVILTSTPPVNQKLFLTQLSSLFSENLNLQEQLKNCLCLFQVSTALTQDQKDLFRKYIPSGIPIVTISEHYGLRTAADFSAMSNVDPNDLLSTMYKNINNRWMGLDRYGIKLEKKNMNSKDDILLNLTNKNFLHALIQCPVITKETAQNFLEKNRIVPGYLQSERALFSFFQYCSQQSDFSNNLVFFLNNYRNYFTKKKYFIDIENLIYANVLLSDFKKINDKEIGVNGFVNDLICNNDLLDKLRNQGFSSIEININGNLSVVTLSEDSSLLRKIRIFTDFIFNEQDYDSLYALGSDIAAFSGDNTFEKVLSHQLIPFLSPEKYEFEKSIHLLLNHSLQYLPEMSDDDKKQFIAYFNGITMRLDSPDKFQSLLSVNLKPILEHWPLIIEKLMQDKNIYNQLKTILAESLLHTAAYYNHVALLERIHELCPSMDLVIPNKEGKTARMIAQERNNDQFIEKLTEYELGNCQPSIEHESSVSRRKN